MADEFEKCINLCLIYSKDLRFLLLKEYKNDKLDAPLVEDTGKGAAQVRISKTIQNELGLEIDPMNWQIVTTLQHIEKKWKIDVYLTVSEIEAVKKEGFVLVNPVKLPDNCHPNLKWLIPMSIDFTIFGSSFNQILMK
jgi:hypothetical protein